MTWVLLIVFVVIQALAGAYLWRLLRRGAIDWVEASGMGLTLGTALAVLSGCLGFFLPVGSWARPWAWCLPALSVAVVWAVRRSRGQRLPALRPPTAAQIWAVLLGVVLGLVVLAGNLARYPLTWAGEWVGYHQDMVFFEALATGTSAFSPSDSILMAGADLRYHWLAYAWSGQLTQAAGAEPFMVLTRVLPVVALLGSLLVGVAWASRLSRQPWVPTLAALLLVSGGYVGAVYGAILNFDSPSQALTTAWLLGLVLAVVLGLRGGPRWGWALVVLVLALAVSGGKFSSIVVAAGGVGLVAVVGLARRTTWRRRAVLFSAMGLLAVAAVLALLVSGSAQAGGLGLWSLLDRASSVQGLNPQTTDRGVIAGTALLILAIAARWAGGLWLAVDRRTRWRPSTVMGAGMAVVGVLTVAFVSGGFNDMWFALAASAPLAVLSAAGIGHLAAAWSGEGPPGQRTPLPRPVLLAFVLGAAAALPVAVIWGTGAYSVGGWRWAAPLAGVILALLIGLLLGLRASGRLPAPRRILALVLVALVAMSVLGRPLYLVVERVMAPEVAPHDVRTYEPVRQFVRSIDREPLTVLSANQAQAGAWLRSTATRGDLVATNVTYTPLVPALTGLRTWISGIHYQAPYGRADAIDDLLARETASWAFIDTPGSATVAPLCAAGVDWVWVDPRRTASRDWQPWAEVAYETADALILRVDSSACP